MTERFSEELVAQAKETSLTQLAEYYGYHPKRVGNQLYTLAEHDSVRIYNDRSWYRWSKAGSGKGSGAALLFLAIAFAGVAVCLLFRHDRHLWSLEEQDRTVS